MIEYCTEHRPLDREALRPEVWDLFDTFRTRFTDREGVSIGPTDCDLMVLWAGWRPVFVRNRSTWFNFIRDANGEWVARN